MAPMEHKTLEAPVDFGIPGELEGGAGIGVVAGLVKRNQPSFVLYVGFQFHVRCKALDHVEAEVRLVVPLAIKSFAALSLR